MSNRNWVCFECRRSVRQVPGYALRPPNDKSVACPECGQACSDMGHKIPVPSRRDIQGWKALKSQFDAEEQQMRLETSKEQVARRHRLEKRIAELESKPVDPERSRLIRKLRDELEGNS